MIFFQIFMAIVLSFWAPLIGISFFYDKFQETKQLNKTGDTLHMIMELADEDVRSKIVASVCTAVVAQDYERLDRLRSRIVELVQQQRRKVAEKWDTKTSSPEIN